MLWIVWQFQLPIFRDALVYDELDYANDVPDALRRESSLVQFGDESLDQVLRDLIQG